MGFEAVPYTHAHKPKECYINMCVSSCDAPCEDPETYLHINCLLICQGTDIFTSCLSIIVLVEVFSHFIIGALAGKGLGHSANNHNRGTGYDGLTNFVNNNRSKVNNVITSLKTNATPQQTATTATT